MTDADAMTAGACDRPADATPRLALADALREAEEPELAAAVADDRVGPELLRATAALSRRLSLPATARLLWCQFRVVPFVNVVPWPATLAASVSGVLLPSAPNPPTLLPPSPPVNSDAWG